MEERFDFSLLAIRSLKISSLPIGTGQNVMPCPGLAFKDKIVEDAQASSDSWETPGINQPVCSNLIEILWKLIYLPNA